MNLAAEPAKEPDNQIEITLELFNFTFCMTEGQARDLMNQLAKKLHEQGL